MAASEEKVSNGASASDAKSPVNHGEKPAPPAAKSGSRGYPKKSDGGGLLAQFKLLRQLSKRPVPTANGDGTYSKTLVRPKLRQDLGRIGINGKCLPVQNPFHWPFY